MEELVTEPEVVGPKEPRPQNIRPIDKPHVAEHIYGLARSNPLLASIRLADSSGPTSAASGSTDETSYGAVFTRISEVEEC